MIRRIRDLLYDQGFTISGARNKMQELLQHERDKKIHGEVLLDGVEVIEVSDTMLRDFTDTDFGAVLDAAAEPWQRVRHELAAIRELLDSTV
jgi:hypothetical protein